MRKLAAVVYTLEVRCRQQFESAEIGYPAALSNCCLHLGKVIKQLCMQAALA